MAQIAEQAFAVPSNLLNSATLLRAAPTGQQAVLPDAPAAVGASLASPLTTLAGVAAVTAAASAVSRRRGQRSRAQVCAFENELGVQAPVGFFDPMGFTKDGDVEDFRRRRESELKNGRVAMFAVMGYITPEYFRFPGFLAPSSDLKFADVPNGLAAIAKVPAEGWLQWVALCGFYEICVNVPKDPAEPGNYGRGRLGFTGTSIEDPEARKRSLNSELANGRLAMMAIFGMMFQNGFIGTTGPAMWIPGAALAEDGSSTALRAGPKVLEGTGGPLPNDFWDPAGLAKGKSDEQLLHWRAVELKHGRVCMLACLGWFHVAAGWHPIGDAAARVRVSDDPMISATQLPIGGAFQVVFTIMCLEWLTTYVCKPPENKPWDILGWEPLLIDDKPDWKENQLKELNNGRLAMMGFVGLVSQEALTGDYAAGVGQTCFGNPICQDWESWSPFAPFPPSAYVQPSLTVF